MSYQMAQGKGPTAEKQSAKFGKPYDIHSLMKQQISHLNCDEVRAFLAGDRVHAFLPESGTRFAKMQYRSDGTCLAEFADGTSDTGVYGFDGHTYWTQYDKFRQGKRFSFYLTQVCPEVYQAFFTDGKRALIQTHLENLPAEFGA